MKQVIDPIPVLQYTMDGEFVGEYPSLRQASLSVGTSCSSIKQALTNMSSHSQGYIWAHTHEDAMAKVKVKKLIQSFSKIAKKKKRITIDLENTNELKLFILRLSRWQSWKPKTRLLKDGTIRVTLTKGKPERRQQQDLPERPNKPKWHLVYEVNLKYKYAMDFGYGDTEEEAIKDFYQSRIDSDLTHTVIYIDQDYEKVRDYLLRKGGRNGKGSVQRLYEAANLLPQQMPRISGI